MQMGEWWTGNDVGKVKRMVGIELVAIVNPCELPTGLLQFCKFGSKHGAQRDEWERKSVDATAHYLNSRTTIHGILLTTICCHVT